MKLALGFVIVLALAGNIIAQEDPELQKPPQPDYSQKNLTQLFASQPLPDLVQPNVQFGVGYVDFRALNMRWRLAYVPMLPLPGSIPWAYNGAFGAQPDPFALTNTEIAYGPRTWKSMREINAELKRIEKSEKAKQKLVAKPE